MKKRKEGETIARVTAGSSGGGKLTLAEWLEWRAREDERIERELAEQRKAYFERKAGATEH